MTGERFGKLVVVGPRPSGWWTIRCDCGQVTRTVESRLRSGALVHCGACEDRAVYARRRAIAARSQTTLMVAAQVLRVRAATKKLIASGALVVGNACELCGSTHRIHVHHEDYTQPAHVMSLCSGCHSRRHRDLHAAGRNPTVLFARHLGLEVTSPLTHEQIMARIERSLASRAVPA